MSKQALVATLALAGAALAAAAELPQAVDAAGIPVYHRVSPSLAASGQPAPDALASLKDLGFRTVVNLRMPAEGPADEKAVVEAQGLRYVHVPMTADSFKLEDVLAVQAVLDDPAAGPVLLHCASSNRVGGVLAAIESRRGKPLDDALAAGRAAGLKSAAMENAVRRVIGAPPLPAPAPASPAAPAPHQP